MGTDDLFKEKRAQKRVRRKEFREPMPNSYLIVTEGTETEPNYFKALTCMIKDKVGGSVDVKEVPCVEIKGKGCATSSLVIATEKLVKSAKRFYQNVWIVMDKDDFEDFDDAISEAENHGYKVAWSNQSFEYWLFLHFDYLESDLHRNDLEKKLNKSFSAYCLGDGKYRKSDQDLFDKLNSIDGVKTAIGNAKRRMANFNSRKDKPSQYAPGTMVHILVGELLDYLN